MPDWRKLVRERIASSALPAASHEEVISELADHLEEAYAAALSQGLTEKAAVEFTLQEVDDWHVLAREISRARSEENLMNNRTRSLWLPAMINVIAAPGLLMILQKLAVQPRVLWIGDMAMVLYLPWLVMLPIFGALGAFLAKRAHARFVTRIIVGLSPALAVLGAFALLLPVSLIDRPGLRHFPFAYFGLTIFNWVLLPALALLVGTLPFLRETNSPSRSEA
jgi:hypothetical protein